MLSTTAQKVGVGHETAADGGGPDPPDADPDAGVGAGTAIGADQSVPLPSLT